MDDIDQIPADPGKINPKYRRIVDADHKEWDVQKLAACEIRPLYKVLVKDRLIPVKAVKKFLGVEVAYVDITLEGSSNPIRHKLTELFWVVK